MEFSINLYNNTLTITSYHDAKLPNQYKYSRHETVKFLIYGGFSNLKHIKFIYCKNVIIKNCAARDYGYLSGYNNLSTTAEHLSIKSCSVNFTRNSCPNLKSLTLTFVTNLLLPRNMTGIKLVIIGCDIINFYSWFEIAKLSNLEIDHHKSYVTYENKKIINDYLRTYIPDLLKNKPLLRFVSLDGLFKKGKLIYKKNGELTNYAANIKKKADAIYLMLYWIIRKQFNVIIDKHIISKLIKMPLHCYYNCGFAVRKLDEVW